MVWHSRPSKQRSLRPAKKQLLLESRQTDALLRCPRPIMPIPLSLWTTNSQPTAGFPSVGRVTRSDLRWSIVPFSLSMTCSPSPQYLAAHVTQLCKSVLTSRFPGTSLHVHTFHSHQLYTVHASSNVLDMWVQCVQSTSPT